MQYVPKGLADPEYTGKDIYRKGIKKKKKLLKNMLIAL